ncbi:MAG: T9SS type A sorting domain-containing protein [Flavobacteriales bacterium]
MKTIAVIGLLALLSLGLMSIETPEPTPYHTPEEIRAMMGGDGTSPDLPVGNEEDFFLGSGSCSGCHGSDPLGIASVDNEGNDVNVVDDWRATMMANSARDPFWRAKVSHETAVNPDNAVELEDKCTSCHSPMGHYGARFDHGAEHYSIAEMLQDSVAMDGVSCNSCHAQSTEGLGDLFSGNMNFSEDTLYGPYGDIDDPVLFSQPMTAFVGMEPVYGEHVDQSEFCAGCHTLITNTADLDGNLTGGTFVEQSTYHEWLNSIYAEEGANNRECQSCHFPRIEDEVVLSANYAFLPGRSPFGKHYMVGGNTFMLELMKNRIDELGITATEEQFDRVIERTMNLLTQETLEMEITELGADDDSLAYEITLTNLTGHKFPSGYPARRAFIEFLVEADNGDTLFHSGAIQDDYRVSGHNETYEPHYTKITSADEVQIYEMVVADTNGDVTTVLERADTYIKDNRLTPKGFTTSHEVYDTTIVAGNALADSNFNFEGGTEGSGSDRIIYKAPMLGYEGAVNVTARVYYQSVPPKWNEEMFMFTTPEIDAFRDMYDEEGADPVLIAEESVSTFVQSTEDISTKESAVVIFPNPVREGEGLTVSAEHRSITVIEIYSMNGQLVFSEEFNSQTRVIINQALPVGAYLVNVTLKDGSHKVNRVVVLAS